MLAKHGIARKERKKLAILAQSVASMAGCGLCGILYLVAASAGGGATNARLFQSSPMHELGLSLNLAYTLYECGVYAIYGKGIEFWAHHVLGIVLLGAALVSGHGHQMIAWAGVSELTNVPLSGLDVLRAFDHKGMLYTLCGVSLWLGFILTRVGSLLLCAGVHVQDLLLLRETSRLHELNPILLYLTLPALLFIWSLSTFWFTKIHSGMLKALSSKGGGGSKGE